jgi:hypothetical protein
MKDVMYGSFNCNYKPNKEEKEHTRLTAGGNRINYPDNCSTPTADMTLFKILVNSILSTPKAKCTMMDIKDFDLRTPMKRPEYMLLKITDIPNVISHTRRICILQNHMRHVRLTTGRNHCPKTPQETTGRIWIPPKQNHQRLLEAQNQAHMLGASCRQLCRQAR